MTAVSIARGLSSTRASGLYGAPTSHRSRNSAAAVTEGQGGSRGRGFTSRRSNPSCAVRTAGKVSSRAPAREAGRFPRCARSRSRPPRYGALLVGSLEGTGARPIRFVRFASHRLYGLPESGANRSSGRKPGHGASPVAAPGSDNVLKTSARGLHGCPKSVHAPLRTPPGETSRRPVSAAGADCHGPGLTELRPAACSGRVQWLRRGGPSRLVLGDGRAAGLDVANGGARGLVPGFGHDQLQRDLLVPACQPPPRWYTLPVMVSCPPLTSAWEFPSMLVITTSVGLVSAMQQ